MARIGLCAVLAGIAVPTLGVGPAAACSCASQVTDAQFREQAAEVFTGTLVRREEPRAGEAVQASTYPAVYTFAVDRVFRGEVTDPQRVVSYVGGATCGLEIQGTGPFVVYTSRGDSVLGREFPAEYADLPRAFLCGGTRALAAGEQPFDDGRTPSPAAAPLTDTTTTLGPTSDDDGSGTAITLGLGVAALALIAGGFVLRRHGRH